MQAKDKNNLITIGILIAMVAVIALVFTGTRRVSLLYVGIGCLAVEVILLMPLVCKKYYQLNGIESSVWMIPYLNVIQNFPAWIGIISSILAVLSLPCFFFLRLPTGILKLFGEDFVFEYGDRMLYYGIGILIVVSILWGIGYFTVVSSTKSYIRECGVITKGDYVSGLESLLFVTLFVPGIRIVGLVQLISLLNNALNIVVEEDTEFEEMDYE